MSSTSRLCQFISGYDNAQIFEQDSAKNLATRQGEVAPMKDEVLHWLMNNLGPECDSQSALLMKQTPGWIQRFPNPFSGDLIKRHTILFNSRDHLILFKLTFGGK